MFTNYQDWEVKGWDKRGIRQTNETKEQFLYREKQKGRYVPADVKKKSSNETMTMSVQKIEKAAEEGNLNLPKISLNLSKKIAQKRCELKMTQKDLAMALSLNKKDIELYENGKAIPVPFIMNKLEKILKLHSS